jgi:hypothetical protein
VGRWGLDASGSVGWGDGDWMHLAQDKDQWRALVNTVMSLGVP